MEHGVASHAHGIWRLAGLGLVSGLLYFAVHVIQDTLLRSALTPVGATTTIWDDPANHDRLRLLLSGYGVAIVGLLVCYQQVVRLAEQRRVSGPACRLAVGLPVVFYLAFLASPAYFSTDVYSYAAYGYIATLPDGNPYFQEGRTILETEFGRQLVELGWRGSALSPYGPVWNMLAASVVRVTPDAQSAVWLLKGVIVATALATGAAAYWVLSLARPDFRLVGAVAVLWNPVCVLMLAAEGHNDAILMLLVVLALGLSIRGSVIGGSFTQCVAILTKYVPVLLLPLQVAYWWRTEPRRPRLVGRLVVAAVLASGLGVVAYAPVWLGAATFMGTGALGSGEPAEPRVDVVGTLLLVGRFGVVAAVVGIGAWRTRNAASLLEWSAVVILVSLLLGPQRFWPWYAALPVALMALTPGRVFRWTILALSGCVLLASPIEALPLTGQGVISFEFQALVFRATRLLPLLVLIGVWLGEVRANHAP